MFGLEARAAALRDLLIVWGIPLLPLFFLGVPIPDTDRTLSLPKVLLPLLVGLWAMAVRRRELESLNRPFVWALLLYLGWLAIGVALAPRPRSVWHLAEEVLYVLLLAGAWACPPRPATSVWRRFAVISVVISVGAVVLALTDVPRGSLAYRAMGTPNVAAAFLVLATLWAIAEHRRALLVVFLIGLVSLGSAGAWLGLVGGALFVLRRRSALVVVGVVAATCVAGLVVWARSPSVPTPTGRHGYRVDAPPPNAFLKNSVEPRVYITRISLAAIGAHSWFGSGLGTYTQAFLEVERRRFAEDEMPWWRFGYPPEDPVGLSAHNDALRIAVETGVPAAILWTLACVGLGWEVRRYPLALALLVAFAIQSMTDHLYLLSNYIAVLWTLIGLAHQSGDAIESGSWRGHEAQRGTGKTIT